MSVLFSHSAELLLGRGLSAEGLPFQTLCPSVAHVTSLGQEKASCHEECLVVHSHALIHFPGNLGGYCLKVELSQDLERGSIPDSLMKGNPLTWKMSDK